MSDQVRAAEQQRAADQQRAKTVEQTKAEQKADYEKQRADREKMVMEQAHPPTPTPTQEENDLLALGLMTPDQIKPSGEPEMPYVDNRRVGSRPATPTSTAQQRPVQPAHTPPHS